MKIKLNANLLNFKAGDTIDIPDKNGIPKDRYWRKRLKDSKIDNCIEIIAEVKEDEKKKNKKSGGNE